MVPVQFSDGTLSWLPKAALEGVPAETSPLSDRFADGRFVDPEWLRRELARNRVTGRLSNIVYSMEATETNFYAYQFKPVLKLLNSPTDGLLIADEVGLGKTIEAGLIWTELRARLESNRLLVLCPKTLCDKWRIELDRRFGVTARIVDASELLQLLSSSSAIGRGYAAIASMQALRPPRDWNEPVDETTKTPVSPRRRLAQFLDEAAFPQSPDHRNSVRRREADRRNQNSFQTRLAWFGIFESVNCAADQASRWAIWVAWDRHHLCRIKSLGVASFGKHTYFECSYVVMGGGRNCCGLLSLPLIWRLETIRPTCSSVFHHASRSVSGAAHFETLAPRHRTCPDRAIDQSTWERCNYRQSRKIKAST